MPKDKKYLSASQVAKRAGVSRAAVSLWIKYGRIKPDITVGTSHKPIYLFTEETVQRLEEAGLLKRHPKGRRFARQQLEVIRLAQKLVDVWGADDDSWPELVPPLRDALLVLRSAECRPPMPFSGDTIERRKVWTQAMLRDALGEKEYQ